MACWALVVSACACLGMLTGCSALQLVCNLCISAGELAIDADTSQPFTVQALDAEREATAKLQSELAQVRAQRDTLQINLEQLHGDHARLMASASRAAADLRDALQAGGAHEQGQVRKCLLLWYASSIA